MKRRAHPKRLLFVCTANQNRSRTAEDVLGSLPGVEARSAGTDVHPFEPGETHVSGELLRWADLVFVMEPYHRDLLRERFPHLHPEIVTLEIEDRYPRGAPELIRLLKSRVLSHLDIEEEAGR